MFYKQEYESSVIVSLDFKGACNSANCKVLLMPVLQSFCEMTDLL